MDKGGHRATVSATEFASLTGVSRERLRTWERRYGFPSPRRVGGGRRRYYLDDAGPVVAVRRAAEQGVPLPAAIEAARGAGEETAEALDPGPAIDLLPSPWMLVAGPAPLRVRHVNRALAAIPGSPRAGQELAGAVPWLAGSELSRALALLFTTDEQSLNCRHPAWRGDSAELIESMLYRVPSADGEQLVAIVTLQAPQARREEAELVQLREHAIEAGERLDRYDRWMAAVGELAELYQREGGTTLLAATTDAIVRRLPPLDAGIAVYMAGELALGSSSRGTLGPRMVTVSAHADVARMLREGDPAWLSPAAAGAFGARAGMQVLAVPVSVLGETLGAVLLVLEQQLELGGELRQLLSVLSAAVGFALLRDRLVEGAAG